MDDARENLTERFVSAAQAGAMRCSAGAAMSVVLGFSLSELLKAVATKAADLGREYRPQIEEAAGLAIDRLTALDIPGLPELIEQKVDEVAAKLARDAVTTMLDAILGVAA